MKLSEIRVDSTLVEGGEWIKDIPDMGELELRVRGIGNTDYQQMQTKLYLATPRGERVGGRLSPKAAARIQAQCLAATVLLDWKGITDDAGEPVPFSKGEALKLLQNPDYVALRDGVVWAAGQVGTNRAEDLDDTVKNLETPSAGI